jgi:hypothetical protein
MAERAYLRLGGEKENEDKRNTPYSFDFSWFYKVECLDLLDNRAYKLYFSSSEGFSSSFLYLISAISVCKRPNGGKLRYSEFQAF